MNKKLINVLKWLISIIVVFVLYWFILPPLNLRSSQMWTFIGTCIIVCTAIVAFSKVVEFITNIKGIKSNVGHIVVEKDNSSIKKTIKSLGLPLKIALISLAVIVVIFIAASISGWTLFSASSYAKLLTYETSSFEDEIEDIVVTQNGQLNMGSVPVVDKDTSQRLSLRKLGEMSDLVSQFEVDNIYNTQINFKGAPTRVTPLVYGDFFKWLNNQSEGIPAYITVNMETQETSLVRLQEGIKYSDSEYLLRDLMRHLRFNYPTKIFDNISFEIDDNGTPYWIASTITYRIGIWSGRDIDGVVICNAVTGACDFYKSEEIPTWVDQAYDSDIIIEQLTYNGEFVNGFWNSVFGQKGVLQPTEGYNYLAINDDVYLYTGMTSVSSDESNVGFVLVNLRTKKTNFYSCPGAEEYSAMESAEGKVQEKNYSATFPLLLNVSGRPTYFMSLKDAAGLVKMYAFVDVQQYQIVATGSSVREALSLFVDELNNSDDVELDNEQNIAQSEIVGTITGIESAVVSSSTKYYIMLDNKSDIYIVDISVNDYLPFVKIGDKIKITLTNLTVSNIEIVE